MKGLTGLGSEKILGTYKFSEIFHAVIMLNIHRKAPLKTERSFLKYIRVTKLDTAKRLSEHIKQNWNKKLLSVA